MRSCRDLGSLSITSFNVRPISSSFLCRRLLRRRQMSCITFVGFGYKALVELVPATTRLVPGYQQNTFTIGIKGESYSPHSTRSPESQFLHIGKPRSVQRIGVRASQLRPVILKQLRHRSKLFLDLGSHCFKFRFEGVVQANHPRHHIAFELYIASRLCLSRATSPCRNARFRRKRKAHPIEKDLSESAACAPCRCGYVCERVAQASCNSLLSQRDALRHFRI